MRITRVNTLVLALPILQSTTTETIVKRYGFVLPGAGITIVKALFINTISVVRTSRRVAKVK